MTIREPDGDAMPDHSAPAPAVPSREAQTELEWLKQDKQRIGAAMWVLVDHLKALGHPFESWPDAVKTAFSDAIIDPRPPTEADLARTKELAERFGWK
jgi:hypothetical protein